MRLLRINSEPALQALGEGLALGVIGGMCAKGCWGRKDRGGGPDLKSCHEKKKACLQTINPMRTQLIKCTLKIHIWK